MSDVTKLKGVIVDIATQLQVIDDRRLVVKEIIDETAKKYNVPKKYISKMAKTYFKDNFDEVSTESEEFSQLYMSVMSRANNDE